MKPRIILDTDMLTDFDDVGALACLHALADAGECEILATVTCTRSNRSVAAVEIINSYYGRPDIPVGCTKEIGISGAGPNSPAGTPLEESGHIKYVKLAENYPQWVRHMNSDDAPDANIIYRRALAGAPDKSVVICSIGFISNMRRLLETGPDEISPLNGSELVARKVAKWVAMACSYPRGFEYNSMWDPESSKIAFENWPTPIVFCDFQYGMDTFAGRAVAELPGEHNPVKDVFKGNIPSREEIAENPARWLAGAFGMGGRAAWDEATVLAAVRGENSYFTTHRGTFRMIGEKGEDEWVPDEENGKNIRLTEKVSKLEVAKIIDELMCRKPKLG